MAKIGLHHVAVVIQPVDGPSRCQQAAFVGIAADDQRHGVELAGLKGVTLILFEQPAIADGAQHARRGQAAHFGCEQAGFFQQVTRCQLP